MPVRISKPMRKHLQQLAALQESFALARDTPRLWRMNVMYQKALREIKRARATKETNDRC